jgi:translation initiation factor 2 subunit 1
MPPDVKYPEESELVLCTVTSVQHHSVFVRIDDYKITGMIHISEIAPGRIRNIRDFVAEGKQVVTKVLRVDPSTGHVDLSLRRVTDSQRRHKANQIKKEKLALKLVDVAAGNCNTDAKVLYQQISEKALEHYNSVFDCFSDIVNGNVSISDLKLAKNAEKELELVLQDRLKPQTVVSKGVLTLVSYAPDGATQVKAALKKTIESGGSVVYLGGGAYAVSAEAETYKKAEAALKKAADAAISAIEAKKGEGSFSVKGKS